MPTQGRLVDTTPGWEQELALSRALSFLAGATYSSLLSQAGLSSRQEYPPQLCFSPQMTLGTTTTRLPPQLTRVNSTAPSRTSP